MALSTMATAPLLLLIGVLAIPTLVGTLNRDAARRRDARRILVELIRLFRKR